MKPRTLLAVVTVVLVPGLVLAAKGNKGKKKSAPAASVLADSLKPFDLNSNRKIDGDEIAAVKKSFAENPKGPLASLDKNANGQLEDGELSTATPSTAAAGNSKGAKPGRAIKKADKNGNGKIDADEVETLRKSLEADPKGALASLDHNGDGKLDDKEIARVNKRLEKGGHGTKSATAPSTTPSTTPPADAAKPAEKTEATK